MSGLFGGGQTISTETPRVSALRINASAYGLAIPLVWGTTRVSGNLIWYGDFTAIPHTTTQSSGGKGGGGVTTRNTTYTYTCAFAMGLCAGQIAGIGQVWSGKDKTSIAALGLTVFQGALPQTPWSYLTSKHPSEALGYNGLAYVAHGAFDLGESSSLPNLSFEVQGPRIAGTLGSSTVIDARPDEILTDLLTDPVSGARFPADRIGSLANWRTYCQAAGFFLSPAITEQAPTKDHVNDLCRMTNSAPVWSEGLLKIIPYGDIEGTGYGATWTPDVTPQYDLTDDDFLVEGDEEPIRIARRTPADAKNYVSVEFLNRDLEYNIDLGKARDAANIAQFGLRPKDPIKMHWITRLDMADAIADVEMRRALYIRNEYEFRLGWRYARLEPMDIVTLTHEPLNLVRAVVRIVSIEESEHGDLDVVAEEMPWAAATPARVTTQEGGGATIDFNVAPGNANTPAIFEPPISLAMRPELWLATSGGANWGGAEVWVSLDDATYKKLGTVNGPARHGILTAQLPSGGDPDVSSVLAVDLGVSRGELISGTLLDRDLLNTLCWVDGELVSYQTATLTGQNRYDLTSLRRGAYGTPIGVHAQNSKFVRCDAGVFRFPYENALVGETLYVKLRSFNIYGGGMQELAAVLPVTYAIAGAPVGAVAGLYAEQPFTGRSAKIAWVAMAGALGYRVEVWAASVLRRTTDTTDTRFEYNFEAAKADGGPWRTLQFKVYALTETGISAVPAVLQLTNPQIGAPQSVAVLAVLEGFSASCARPGDTDYGGCRIWASQTQGFDPNVTAPIYDGADTAFIQYGLTPDAVWYVRIGCYDVFGTDGMTLSSEFTVTIRGVSADPATMLAEINTLLTDGSGTAKIELLADRFSIKGPDSNKVPFALVEVSPGVWKALLDAEVLIGGNVSVANLSAGALPNDVIFSLGGGMIQLDGAGEIRAYAAPGANQDFVSLTAAELLFKMYVAGTGYVTYNYLSRIETGVAANNDTVTIPGYWKEQPRVMISPSSLGLYKAAYAAQDQSIQCQALSLQETSAGSKRWQFQAVATLSLAANTGQTQINAGSGDISANNWTSNTYTTAANCINITPSVTVKSQRGNGSSQYFYRSIRWRVEYWNGSAWVALAWRTVNMGAQFNAITDSGQFTFPGSGTWQWRIYAESYDTDGTVFGSITYQYSTETITGGAGSGSATANYGSPSYVSQTVYCALSGSTLNPTWEIYEITYSWQHKWDFSSNYYDLLSRPVGNGTFSSPRDGSNYTYVAWTYSPSGVVGTWQSKSVTQSGSSLSYNANFIYSTVQAAGVFYESQWGVPISSVTYQSGQAVVKRRTPVANSTTPVNNCLINYYDFSLSSAQVLAAGSLNWIAMGR